MQLKSINFPNWLVLNIVLVLILINEVNKLNLLIYLSSPYLTLIVLWLIVILISKHNTRNLQQYMMKKYNWTKSEFIRQDKLQRTTAMNRVPFFTTALLLAWILATIIAFIVSLSQLFINFPNYSSPYAIMIIVLGLGIPFIGPLFLHREKKSHLSRWISRTWY